jgi:hypothetical protein
VVVVAVRAWGCGRWPWWAMGCDVGGWGVVTIAGPSAFIRYRQKRKKKDSPLRGGPGRGGPLCVRCSRASKNPQFYLSRFGCVGVRVVVAVDTEEQGGCGHGCGRAGHWVHYTLDRHKKKNKKGKNSLSDCRRGGPGCRGGG